MNNTFPKNTWVFFWGICSLTYCTGIAIFCFEQYGIVSIVTFKLNFLAILQFISFNHPSANLCYRKYHQSAIRRPKSNLTESINHNGVIREQIFRPKMLLWSIELNFSQEYAFR